MRMVKAVMEEIFVHNDAVCACGLSCPKLELDELSVLRCGRYVTPLDLLAVYLNTHTGVASIAKVPLARRCKECVEEFGKSPVA